MPPDVLEVTKKFMRDPIQILVKKEELTLEGIKQFYIQVEKEVSIPSKPSFPVKQVPRFLLRNSNNEQFSCSMVQLHYGVCLIFSHSVL